MQAGASMEEGMGMLRDGNATSENRAPSLGRGMGVGSTTDTQMTNGPMSQHQATHAMGDMQHMHGMKMPTPPEGADKVPLYPQDAFMESHMMAMDEEVNKPETTGLPTGWSGFVGGMMTLVRVMPPAKYDEVMKLKAQQAAKGNNAR
jgi:hypothetical protein